MSFRKIEPFFPLLFLSNLAILFVGMGLFPVLPHYSAQFGAGQTLVGLFFGIITAMLAAGSLAAGFLAARFPIRSVYVLSGLAGVPALILLGQAGALWQVVLLTSAVWFFGGLNMSLTSMLIGMLSDKETRGRYFSLLALTVPMGALFGGAGVGALLAAYDYRGMLFVLGLLWNLVPLAGILLRPEEPAQSQARAAVRPRAYKIYSLDEPFAAVLFISLISAIAISFARLGAPLAMQLQAFSPVEVANSVMFAGLVSIPVVLLSSLLTDRVSRARFLIVAYLSAAAGMAILVFATQLWHYWASASFVMIAFCLNGAMASAAAADVLPPAELKRGLAWLNTAIPAASILAFAGTGFLGEYFDFRLLFLLATALPVAAASLMEAALQRCRRALPAQPEPLLEAPVWDENGYFRRCL